LGRRRATRCAVGDRAGDADAECGNEPGDEAPFSLDTSNLGAAMADLSARVVEFGDVMGDGSAVPRMARLTDPDGNRVLLIEAPSPG